jgi:hypothetical protein
MPVLPSARCDHLNSVDRDDANVTGPFRFSFDERANQRGKSVGSGRMDSKQRNAGVLERTTSLNGNLPKVFVERNHDSRIGFCPFKQGKIRGAGKIGTRPQYIVTVGAERLHNELRKILVSE